MLDLTKIEPISSESFQFGPIQTKWLEALESGNYKQGRGCLNGPNGFCCLGVLCEVMGLEHEPIAGVDGPMAHYKYEGSHSGGYVPLAAVPATGLNGSAGSFKQAVLHGGLAWDCLTSLNDTVGLSFPEIAAYIRHDPHNVFKAAA